MKKFRLITYILLLTAAAAGFNGCKDDNDALPPDVIFTVATDGYAVTFNNTTEGVSSFKWDFGDGGTSTEKSPVHTYPGKGKYVATLYAVTAAGDTVEGSTVLRISKTTPVKLGDESLTDWDNVTKNVYTPAGADNAIKQVKLDYDGNMVYIYMEVAGTLGDSSPIFDFYLDTDNSSATGYLTGSYPEGGYDVLMEGQILTGWFDVFYHTGEQTSFSGFHPQPISEPYTLGKVTEQNGIIKFECGLVRSKLKNLAGTGLRIAIAATKSDWTATLGSAPAEGTAAYFINLDE